MTIRIHTVFVDFINCIKRFAPSIVLTEPECGSIHSKTCCSNQVRGYTYEFDADFDTTLISRSEIVCKATIFYTLPKSQYSYLTCYRINTCSILIEICELLITK